MKGNPDLPRRKAAIGFHVTLQILAAIVILGAVNYIGFEYYKRWDFSRSQKFVLAEQTKRALKQLQEPLKVIVYFSPTALTPDAQLYSDVNNLLKELQFSGKNRLDVEYVDPSRNFTRAKDLQTKYKFGANENVLILDYMGKSKFIPVWEMADWSQSLEEPEVTAFKGEQAFTTALLELLTPEQRKVYFTQGNGEPNFAGDSPISLLKEYIERQSLKSEAVNLATIDAIPDDCGVLFLCGPRADLPEREIAMIRAYWEKQGSLIVLCNPDANTPNLHTFLTECGVKPLDMRVLRTVNLGFATGILREVTGDFVGGTPIAKRLQGFNTLFPGATQPLELLHDLKGLQASPLILAAEGFWGETKYAVKEGEGVYFDAEEDLAVPVVIAASVEKGGLPDENVQMKSSKLVVVGNSVFIENEAPLTEVNLDFVLSTINWMLERAQVAGITPKPVRLFELNLTDTQTGAIATYTMVVLPGAAALIGLIVWWRRRK